MTLGVRPGLAGRTLVGIGQHDVSALAHDTLYEDARHSLQSLGPFWRSGILYYDIPPLMMTSRPGAARATLARFSWIPYSVYVFAAVEVVTRLALHFDSCLYNGLYSKGSFSTEETILRHYVFYNAHFGSVLHRNPMNLGSSTSTSLSSRNG